MLAVRFFCGIHVAKYVKKLTSRVSTVKLTQYHSWFWCSDWGWGRGLPVNMASCFLLLCGPLGKLMIVRVCDFSASGQPDYSALSPTYLPAHRLTFGILTLFTSSYRDMHTCAQEHAHTEGMTVALICLHLSTSESITSWQMILGQ